MNEVMTAPDAAAGPIATTRTPTSKLRGGSSKSSTSKPSIPETKPAAHPGWKNVTEIPSHLLLQELRRRSMTRGAGRQTITEEEARRDAQKLKAIRETMKHMSQKEWAAFFGVSQAAMSYCLHGLRPGLCRKLIAVHEAMIAHKQPGEAR